MFKDSGADLFAVAVSMLFPCKVSNYAAMMSQGDNANALTMAFSRRKKKR